MIPRSSRALIKIKFVRERKRTTIWVGPTVLRAGASFPLTGEQWVWYDGSPEKNSKFWICWYPAGFPTTQRWLTFFTARAIALQALY